MVGQPLGLDHMGERQHERRVRGGTYRNPFAPLRRVRPLRADIDAAHAAGGETVEPAGRFMFGDATHADLGVLRVDTAEHDQRFGVVVDGLPAVLMLVEKFQKIHAENMRHDRLRAAGGIAAERGDVTADAVEEPVHLALRVMKAPGRTPPVGPAKDRFVPIGAPHPVDIFRRDIERLVPGQLDEILAPPAPGRAVFQPATADRRARNARAVMHRRRQDFRDQRRMWIFGKRAGRDNPVPRDIDFERAPMARGDFCHPCRIVCHRHLAHAGRAARPEIGTRQACHLKGLCAESPASPSV